METTNLPPMPDPNAQQPDTGNSNQGHKKALLQKLMSNLLGKPGRSLHEIVDGVKQAIGAYKNYAKEWDTLNGVVQGAATGGTAGAVGGAAKNSIQDIMAQIQKQKAQTVPMNTMPNIPPMPQKVPMMPMPQMQPATPPQGQPQPPFNGAGGPGDTQKLPNMGGALGPVNTKPSVNPGGTYVSAPLAPISGPYTKSPPLGNFNPIKQTPTMPTKPLPLQPFPTNPPVNPGGTYVPAPKQTPTMPTKQPNYPRTYEPWIQQNISYEEWMKRNAIAGQPQTSTFNRPAPVSNLGIHGF